jgi:branched-chain amino acid transport system permease protein
MKNIFLTALYGNKALRWRPVVVIAVMCALPYLVSEYYLYVAIFIMVNALFAQSFNLLFGYGGKLSFGQAAYFGIGAYTVGLLLMKVKAPLWIAMIGGVLVSGLFAMVIGFFCIRRVGMYFAILTMAFGQFIFLIVDKWYSVTGGHDGLQGIPVPPILNSVRSYYYYSLAMVACSIFLIHRVIESPFGYTLRALRDNPTRCEFNGSDGRRIQLIAFVISGMFCGVAGGVFAPFNRSIAPSILDWTKSAEPVIMAIIGGQLTFWGPVFGAFMFTILQMIIVEVTSYWPLVIGIILAFTVLFMPGGVVGFINQKITGVSIPES